MPLPPAPTKTWTFFEGEWLEGNPPIMGPRTHAAWMSSTVFDGARAFEGVTPDLDLHCARVNRSATALLLDPVMTVQAWVDLVREGLNRFDADAELYIRPMYWAESGMGGGVLQDRASTRWCLCIYEAPLPKPKGVSVTLSPFRRPDASCAPVEAKAGCLYPNGARAIWEAQQRGFDNCLMLDLQGQVAELANANIFCVRDGVVLTPEPNGAFLNGITRQRVIGLLRGAGEIVVERTMTVADFEAAEEIFSCGNFAKVAPVTRFEERSLEPGRVAALARDLYWSFAHAG